MTSPQADATTDPQSTIAALQQRLDAVLAEKAALAEALATRTAELGQRNTDYSERIEHQSATIDVLRAMSASPGDAQPVFDLIVRQAQALCNSTNAALYEYDGAMVHHSSGTSNFSSRDGFEAYRRQYPMLLNRQTHAALASAILDRRIVHIRDSDIEEGVSAAARSLGVRSAIVIPLIRDDGAAGAIALINQEPGGFSDSQIELLKTFAEQAVIALASAAALRALTERTADLQVSLEYQTATSDVLKVISGSEFELEPVFQAVVETATRLCHADQAVIYRYHDGVYRWAAGTSLLPDYERIERSVSIPPGTGTVVGRVALEHRPIEILDALADPLYEVKDDARVGGIRTLLGVPLMRDGTSIGVIGLARQRVEAFTERQIELVKIFADQAVIAIENTRLITEQREALEQQTATAEVLQVINASPGNLAPVFDAMLEKAMRLCGVAFGMMTTFDGERFHPIVWRGLPAALSAYFAEGGGPSASSGMHGRLVAGAALAHVVGMKDEEAYRSGYAARRALVDLGGAQTGLAIALRKDDALLGTFMLYRQEIRPFTDKQIALLQNFAAQAVIAMENARLITEQREALEQQTATAEVLQVINASPGNLTPVFDTILEKAMRLCDAAFGVFYAYDGTSFRTVVTRGVPAAFAAFRAKHPPIPGPGSPIGRALETKRPDHVFDWLEEPDYKYGTASGRAIADVGGARTVLNVPLVKDTAVLGMISFYRQQVRPFSDKQIALLENFAAQAVIAMENARLITEQREALEQQTATAEVLQVINASPGDLAPVFDAILDKAHSLCGATVGNLTVYKEGYFQALATHGLPEEIASLLRQPFHPNPTSQGLIDGARFHQIEDIRAIEIDSQGPITRALVAQTDVRTVLFVPMRKDGALFGFISVHRPEVRPFSEKEIALLENFAAQAVIAMENARLLTEQREALEQQTATAEVLQVINASPGNLTPVFEAILDKAHNLCDVAVGSLSIYLNGVVHTAATRGFSEEYQALLRRPYPAIGSHQALMRGGPSRQTSDFRTVPVSPEMASSLDHLERMNLRTGLWVPLRKDGTALGCISSYRDKVQPFSEKEIALLENFAAQAVIAMENARLLDEIRQRQEELRVTFENMGDGVAMFDETQHLVAWNRKFQDILDVPDDIIARRQTFSEYVRYLAERGEYDRWADPAEHVRQVIEQAGQSRTYERTRPDGRVIEIRHNPVPGGGFVLIYADITERKRNEAEIRAARDAAEEASRTVEVAYRDLKAAQANLIQAEKMASLGQLTAGIAHEIKNPLNFVNNFASLSIDLLVELKQAAAPGFAILDADRRADLDELTSILTDNLQRINEHGRRADSIVKNMLLHSRSGPSEHRLIDLNSVVEEALNLAYQGARAEVPGFNITIEKRLDPAAGMVEMFPQEFTRVMLNLFSNGFYATRTRADETEDRTFEPTLLLATHNLGDQVEIRVRDNGSGISEGVRSKIFEPFFTTKPAGKGTGLGLSLSYDIVVKQHRGTLTMDSRLGEFTEFIITLPRAMAMSDGG